MDGCVWEVDRGVVSSFLRTCLVGDRLISLPFRASLLLFSLLRRAQRSDLWLVGNLRLSGGLPKPLRGHRRDAEGEHEHEGRTDATSAPEVGVPVQVVQVEDRRLEVHDSQRDEHEPGPPHDGKLVPEEEAENRQQDHQSEPHRSADGSEGLEEQGQVVLADDVREAKAKAAGQGTQESHDRETHVALPRRVEGHTGRQPARLAQPSPYPRSRLADAFPKVAAQQQKFIAKQLPSHANTR